jgi:predicted TIM-barrel fold metal-dependent hydrolase
MRIIDTHLHLIDLERLRYPWLDGVPALKRDFTLEDYWRKARPLGIEGALHMEVDVTEQDIGAETQWAANLGPPVIGVIAAGRPESPEFPAWLERAAADSRLRGFRRILHTSPDELGRQPIFTENLRRLATFDLSFDLCVQARQLPIAAEIARACPDVQFVLDHCGVPDVKAKALDQGRSYGLWRAGIAEIAALPNVACKISGIVAYAEQGWTPEDLRPFVEHCIAAFGWERVVWGSDHPVLTLTADLGSWVAATKAIVAGASPDEKAALFHRNAERIYRL